MTEMEKNPEKTRRTETNLIKRNNSDKWKPFHKQNLQLVKGKENYIWYIYQGNLFQTTHGKSRYWWNRNKHLIKTWSLHLLDMMEAVE